MAYQFVHMETYSRKAKPVRGDPDQVNTGDQIFGEAARLAHFSRHVETPRDVLKIAGTKTLNELRSLWKTRISEVRVLAKSKHGTSYEMGLKSDAPTIYTEIHSYPITSAEYHSDGSGDKKREIDRWRDLVIADFRRRMPQDIDDAMIMHLDETNVHLHIIAVNTVDPRLDANKLHVGKKAAADLRRNIEATSPIEQLPRPVLVPMPRKPKRQKKSKSPDTQSINDTIYAHQIKDWTSVRAVATAENNRRKARWKIDNRVHISSTRDRQGPTKEHHAYKAAMREFQDGYFKNVGQPCGLLRSGPNVQRSTTKQRAAEKQHEKQLAEMREAIGEANARRVEAEAAVEAARATLRDVLAETANVRQRSDDAVRELETAVQGKADAEGKARAVIDVATATNERLTSAYNALEREIKEGTLIRRSDGTIGARDMDAITRGRPEIDPAVRSAMRTIDALAKRRAAFSAEEADLAQRKASIELHEAQALNDLREIRLHSDWLREAQNKISEYLSKLQGWLRRPDLPDAARDAALELSSDGDDIQAGLLKNDAEAIYLFERMRDRGMGNGDRTDSEQPREEDSGPGP